MARRPDAAPVVCDLGALGASRGRHARLLRGLLESATAVRETARGFRLELPGAAPVFRAAAAWVALERRCCGFAGFHLRWSPAGRLTLEVGAADPLGREALREGLRKVLGSLPGPPVTPPGAPGSDRAAPPAAPAGRRRAGR